MGHRPVRDPTVELINETRVRDKFTDGDKQCGESKPDNDGEQDTYGNSPLRRKTRWHVARL